MNEEINFGEYGPIILLMKSSNAAFLFVHSAWHIEVTRHTFAELLSLMEIYVS